jgi:hypothetical protein
MADDAIVVTAPFVAGSAGAAYVYRWDGRSWREEQKLIAPDGSKGAFFGGSVDIGADLVVVGADHVDDCGALYVFCRASSSWSAAQKLCPEDGSVGAEFGYSVSMKDDEIIVGAPSARGGGAAYVYSRQDGWWTETQRLTGWESSGSDFGRHVAHALREQTLIVGGSRADEDGIRRSVAHLFQRAAGVWQPFALLGPRPSH